MIYFCGDTHGDIDVGKIRFLVSKNKISRDDILIILGDCGVLFYQDKEIYEQYIKLYESFGLTILYLDGNHENFPLIHSFPETTIYGAKAHKISDHIFYICRGEILEIEGHTFLCVGGATSIDREYRIEGVSWWREENISESDMENAFDNLKRYDNKVDFILTHCVDTTSVYFGLHFRPDENTNKLEELEAKASYRCWLCGHYHCDIFLSSKKAVLYNRIAYLDEDSDILVSFVDD